MKWVWRGVAGFAVVAVVAVAGGFLWLRTSLPQLSGTIRVNGPAAVVEIIRDRNAVPHILARSAADAYYALGFVHAQDRLFQMDFMRRLGAGRLSEVVGAATLGIDRTMRVLGLYRRAEASFALLSPAPRAAITAYAAGVNAYLRSRPGAPPLEFIALGYRPEPWRPADSMVWGRIMAMRLTGNWRTEALRAVLLERLTVEQVEALWPGAIGGVPPTVEARAVAGDGARFAALLRAWPDEIGPVEASNSWAVAGTHTASGKPILANDPHLGFRAPGLWYPARLQTPHFSVTGVTVPGVPFTVLGHNGRIAWAFTTTESDTQDLFTERVDPTDPGRYLIPAGSLPFDVRHETIRVKDAAEVPIVVRETRHGPVVSDIDPGLAARAGAGRVIALQAAALRADDRTIEAVFSLNRAHDWDGFVAALRDFHAPQQNISYADVDGNIGFLAPGRVPIRTAGSGALPAPGWTGTHDWRGFIPFDQLPRALNPRSGRIVNANHRVAPDGYPYHLGQGGAPGYRARRIHALLDGVGRPYTTADAAAMQTDSVSLAARELLPLMTRIAPTDARARQALAALRTWDGTMDRARAEPLVFVAWLRALNRRLYADELGAAFESYWRLRPVFVKRALTDRRQWCDDVKTSATETCAARLEAALNDALERLAAAHGADVSAWRWGEAHQAVFRHPLFGRVPVLRRLADRRIESDGGAFTINRAQHWIGNAAAPYASVHGPGYRAVYDLADPDNSLFMEATGQSGNPLSPRYGDRIEAWRDGRLFRIPGSRAAALDGARGVLRLEPDR